jgi:RHS repeat-associated protein
MTSSSDGNGVTSSYTYSPAGEILSLTSSLSDATDPAAILSGVQDGPFGPVSYTLGNGLSDTYSYDALGRLSGGTVSSGGTQVYGFANGWKGKLLTGSSDSVLNQGSTYGYDEFNRLTSLTVNSGTGPNYGWVYDRYGNRLQQNITGGTGSGSTFTASVNAANNQLVGYTYDAAGNMTYDEFHSYTFDAEGHITAVDGGQTATYVYNALNQRVRATVGGAITEYLFNAAGQRVSEWNGATRTQLKGKYYWGAKPVAYYAGGTHFEHQDWLGTERMRTAYNGGVEGSYISLPFGDGQATSGVDTDANHYAMLDHDTQTDTDYAQFRQYANMQGRWLSPDPYGGSYSMGNPQSFNRYVYAGNNPLAATDTNGLCYEANAYDGFACPLNDQGGSPQLTNPYFSHHGVTGPVR